MYVRDYTFFFSSTDMALASLRNIALPQRSSRKLVNWWYFHLRKAEAASWNSLSVQLLSASNNGLTEMQAITRQNSQRSQAIRIGRRLISITGMCYVLSTRAIDSSNVACNKKLSRVLMRRGEKEKSYENDSSNLERYTTGRTRPDRSGHSHTEIEFENQKRPFPVFSYSPKISSSMLLKSSGV